MRRTDEEWGEVPVLVTTSEAALADVRSAVQEALGRAARPAAVLRVEAVPLLASGKPDRRALEGLAATAD